MAKRKTDGRVGGNERKPFERWRVTYDRLVRALLVVLTCLVASGCTKKSSTESVAKRSERLHVTSGLVAAYDFDEGSGTSATDASGTGNTGTLSGPSWFATGRRGGALSFDGVNDRVTIPDANSLDLTSGMTLMAWVKPDADQTDWGTVVMKERGASGLSYALYATDGNGTPVAYLRRGTQDRTVTGDHHSPRADRWTHLAATYNGSAFRFYVNGKLQNSTSVSGSITTSTGVLDIGGNAPFGEWFHGLIDEVRVYNRGLSESEVTLEMDGVSPGPAPALVAAYGFDEGAGTAAGDASGMSNTGALSGATWSASGKHGSALQFDGQDDRVVVTDSPSLDVRYGMTLSAWVKPTALSDWRTVLLKEHEDFDLGYSLYASNATGNPIGYINHDGVGVSVQAPSSLPLDTWSHVAATYNDLELNLYVDGQLAASQNHDGDILATDGALSIGGNAVWGEWFEGLIDDVRIYNNGLTAAQITTDMNTAVGGGSGCGTGCDDGNPCNGVETCVNGSCLAGTPITCAASDQCHDAGTCNTSTGVCSNPAKTNGSACNDANACTQSDSCQSGTCTGSNPVTCTAQDSCHDAGTCNTSTGACSNPAKANGSACNDATVCNGSETCQSGSCTAGTPPTVNDGNPCTTDACDAVAGVTHTPVATGTSCTNGNACDGAETCNASATCVAGAPPTTNDGNPCTADACDPTAGVTHTPVATGTLCLDANACNGAETCNSSGTCVAGNPPTLDDGNACTADSCDQTSGVSHTPVATGTSCSDLDACNGSEVCNASGTCQPGTPVSTDDGNECTDGVCDPLTGAVTQNALPTGTECFLDVCTVAECNASGECTAAGSTVMDDGDPCTIEWCDPELGPQVKACTPIDRTVGTTLNESMKWIYEGSNPPQIGVAPGTIEVKRASAFRGIARTRDGGPLPGVKVTILDHPEFGYTLTHADGYFDMVVNGGGALVVVLERPGYPTVQRSVGSVWGEHAAVPEIVMTPLDPVVSPIDLTSTAEEFQVAQGSVESDADGTRQGTLLVPAGTEATVHLPNGDTVDLETMNVRITEFTVGATGPDAMPGELPAASKYTYAFEASIDEADAAGAKSVTFSTPLPYYVDNFLGFPAETPIPLGYFDRETSTWKRDEGGVTLDIVGEIGGLAEIDVTGDGVSDTGSALEQYGITDSERAKLAALYEPGKSLWRVLIRHFTPWDCNMGGRPPDGAQPPNNPEPKDDKKSTCDSEQAGASTIQCESQVLRESIPIAGTPYSLNYSSARVVGRKAAYQVEIPVTSTAIPFPLVRVNLEVTVAGRTFHYEFPPLPNQKKTFVWDGLDAFGRRAQGAQVLFTTVKYVYAFNYSNQCCGKGQFGYNGNGTVITVNNARTEFSFPQSAKPRVGLFDATEVGLGGWTLDGNHFHNLAVERLDLGEGTTIDNTSKPFAARRSIAGPPSIGLRIVVGPDGDVYGGGGGVVWRTKPGFSPTVFAGTPGALGHAGDGLPATDPSVRIGQYSDLALGRDGSLYIAETQNHIVRRVRPDGIIETFAGIPGTTSAHAGEDGQPATEMFLLSPFNVAVGPDDSVYVTTSGTIRRIAPDGTMSTVAGIESSGPIELLPEDGAVAQEVDIEPGALAVAPDGVLYAALRTCSGFTCATNRIVRIVDGRIYHVAGNDCVSVSCGSSDGVPAKLAHIVPDALAIDPAGGIYFMENHDRIRALTPDGFVTTVASRFDGQAFAEGIAATAARLLPQDIAFGPDGLFVGGGNLASDVYRVLAPLPSETGASFVIGARSQDAVYSFNSLGRHLSTRHSLTGTELRRFTYLSGRLSQVSDESGLQTQIERDASGNPTAIIGPFGQRTELELDPNGYLARVTDPENQSSLMAYTSDGLLTSFTNPRGKTSTMDYDSLGRLELDEDAVGGSHSLVRTESSDGIQWTLERTTALGRTTTYTTTQQTRGNEQKVIVEPGDTETTVVSTPDQLTTVVRPDGTVTTTSQTPDQRFGPDSPVTSQTTLLPSGLTSTLSTTRSYVALNPTDPLDFVQRRDTTTRNGRNWVTVYEQASRTFTNTSPQSRQTFRVLDAQGRTSRTQIAGLLPVDFFYDASGRLDHVTQGPRTTQNAYVPSGASAGYLQSITDATNTATTFTRDALGRTLTETRAGATTSFGWDPVSNLSSVTPPGKPLHEMNYTPVNLLESYEPPPAGLPASATSYDYDLDRMLRTETRPGGVSIVRTPDSAGRLDTVAIPGGLIDYAYVPSNATSGAGKVSSIAGPYGVDLAFTYDGSLTTSTTWSGDVTGSVAWQYNNDFQKILETVSGATGTASTAFGYDNDLLLTCASPTTCSPPGADALTLMRSPQHGMVTNISLGQTSEAWTYNGFGELARQTASFNGSPLLDIIYDEAGFERDALGRIVRKTETILGVTKVYEYRYDALRRLDQVKIDGVVDEEFTYDANGNRLTAFKAGQGTVTATYDDQDRLLTYGTYVFTYTANGELETKTNTANGDEWLFQYDALGNLVSVGLPNGDLVEYLLDGMGRRVGKKKNGVLLKQWIYRNPLKPVAELDGSGNLVSEFVYGSKPNVPDYVVRGGVTYRVSSDDLGSPRRVVNVANSTDVPFSAAYTSFGEMTGTGIDWMPFGFAGGHHDAETGLTRFGARDYDPAFGRWLAKDPIRFVGDGPGLYVYAQNDPINHMDVTGRQSWLDVWDAQDAAEQKFPGETHNGRGDAYKHCMASCSIAQRSGDTYAWLLGELNELKGDLFGQPQDERDMDDSNNACGRSLASDDTDCSLACLDALESGALQTL